VSINWKAEILRSARGSRMTTAIYWGILWEWKCNLLGYSAIEMESHFVWTSKYRRCNGGVSSGVLEAKIGQCAANKNCRARIKYIGGRVMWSPE
jgi:hypothetical protein